MNTGRKYIPQEIAALRAHNQNNQNVIFSDKDFEELAAGTARLKVQHRADKAMDEIKRRVERPMGRLEAYITFVTINSFGKFLGEDFEPRINRMKYALDVLIEKGNISEEEITKKEHEYIAGTWPHFCEKCNKTYPGCAEEFEVIEKEDGDKAPKRNVPFFPKVAKAIFPDLTGELADKIVECSGFEQKPVEEKEVQDDANKNNL